LAGGNRFSFLFAFPPATMTNGHSSCAAEAVLRRSSTCHVSSS